MRRQSRLQAMQQRPSPYARPAPKVEAKVERESPALPTRRTLNVFSAKFVEDMDDEGEERPSTSKKALTIDDDIQFVFSTPTHLLPKSERMAQVDEDVVVVKETAKEEKKTKDAKVEEVEDKTPIVSSKFFD